MNPMIFEFNVPNTFARINIDSNHGAKCKFFYSEINKSKWSSLSGSQLPCGRFGKNITISTNLRAKNGPFNGPDGVRRFLIESLYF